MKKITLLLILIIPIIASAQITIFSQDFSGSSTVSSYVSAIPDVSQFTSIVGNATNNATSITSNALRYTKTGGSTGYFARTSAFAGPPPLAQVKFDFQVSGNPAALNITQATFYLGAGITDATSIANADFHSRVVFNFDATVGNFSLRDGTNGSSYAGKQSITFVVNNSGSTLTYKAPDNSIETIANDTYDIWVGITKEFNDKAATTPTSDLTKFKFLYPSGSVNAAIDIDNIVVQSLDIVIPTFTALYPKTDNISITSFELVSNINEIGTTYYVVLPDGATAPTSAQVLAGKDAINTAAGFSGSVDNAIANTDYLKSVTGLTLNTAYDVYLVAQDVSGNLQTSPVKLDVNTLTTLPISLTSFTAKPVNQTILLNWNTASEVNNNYFDVLRSVNGKSFTAIGTVNGLGDSKGSKDYSFVDENPYAGTNYYQLVQHDFDGKTSSSAIISADSKIAVAKLLVFANSSEVKISITSPNQTKGLLQLFDISGRKLAEQSIAVNKGFNNISFPASLKNGVHFVSYIADGEVMNQKFTR
jgi:hypothetical protein